MQELEEPVIKRAGTKETEPSRQSTILKSQSCNYVTDKKFHLLSSSELKKLWSKN